MSGAAKLEYKANTIIDSRTSLMNRVVGVMALGGGTSCMQRRVRVVD